eukprot:7261527-Prymnesium_polylepis.1
MQMHMSMSMCERSEPSGGPVRRTRCTSGPRTRSDTHVLERALNGARSCNPTLARNHVRSFTV